MSRSGPVLAAAVLVVWVGAPGRAAADTPTFARDVAAIVFSRCAPCHRPGGSAPFSLLTYADVRGRAKQIDIVTRSRFMPPWLPEMAHGLFVGDRSLSARELTTIADWVAAGAPEGDPAMLPSPPSWSDEGWQIGTPDLVVRTAVPFVLPADGIDVYRNFVVPIETSASRFVRAVEFTFDNPTVVHHARLLIDRTDGARRLDEQDPDPGYDGMLVDDAVFPDGHFLGWSPGKAPSPGDETLAWRLDPGTDLVAQLHMVPTGRPETIHVSIGLYWAAGPPTRTPIVLTLGSKTIDIPAGDSDYAIDDGFDVPVDVEVLRVYPHAHYLGREIEATVTVPDGPPIPLLRIPAWDFNWQDEYEYARPVRLPAGSRISVRITYDNSAANVRNPNAPPARVVYGSRSSDEMGEVLFQVVPVAVRDSAVLEAASARKTLAMDLAGYEKLLVDRPGDTDVHNALSFLYQRAGRPDRAIQQLRAAVDREPGYAMGHYNLGVLLWERGTVDEAIASLRRAVEQQSDYPEAHNNLGVMLQATGRLPEAVAHYRLAATQNPRYALPHSNLASVYRLRGHIDAAAEEYRRALTLQPDLPEAHGGLGIVLATQGRTRDALVHLDAALDRQPDQVELQLTLAWILATHGDAAVRDPARAVELATRAAAQAGARRAFALDALAAAHAAAADFPSALTTANEALELAILAGLEPLAAGIRERQALYGNGRPYVEPDR